MNLVLRVVVDVVAALKTIKPDVRIAGLTALLIDLNFSVTELASGPADSPESRRLTGRASSRSR